MVTKKEGATMECKNCDTELICRLKDYGGDYKPTLQWQNYDGTAHYKTSDGKNFSCNVPEEDGETKQTHIPSAPSNAPSPKLGEIENKIDRLLHDVDTTKGMVEALFKKMVDEQIGRVDE